MKNEINENQIIQAINNFKFKKEAAKSLDISIYKLNLLLKTYDLIYPKHHIEQDRDSKIFDTYSFVNKRWLEDNWINTSKSLTELAQEYNVSAAILEGRRAYYRLKKPFKYHVADTLYNKCDPNVAYLAGLIATDGYIPKNRLAVELDLTGDDELQLLIDIKKYFNISAEIAKYGQSNRLRISSRCIVDFFESEYNLYGENKTFNVDVPKSFESEDCARAYVRGCIDGDGTVYPARYQFLICNASHNFISGLADIIERYTGQHLNVRERKGKNSKYYCIGTTDRKARLILSWVYDISDRDFKLNRKYLKFKMNNYKVDDIV